MRKVDADGAPRRRRGRVGALAGLAVLVTLAGCGGGAGAPPQGQSAAAMSATAQSSSSSAPASSESTSDSATAPTPTPAAATPEPDTVPLSNGAVAIPVAGTPPVTGHPWYLAIGDSITAGYTVDPSRTGVNSAWPLQLQPMLAARGEDWTLFDTACPGETLASFDARCPGRAAIPLLADRSQHDVAFEAIHAHAADLRLVLIDLGSNDLLHALQQGRTPQDVASSVSSSLSSIIHEVQAAAPGVPVVVANYYDPLANLLPATAAELVPVNDAIASVTSAAHARLADFHAAINGAATPNPDLGQHVDAAHADIHPTVLGHTVLARTALAVIP